MCTSSAIARETVCTGRRARLRENDLQTLWRLIFAIERPRKRIIPEVTFLHPALCIGIIVSPIWMDQFVGNIGLTLVCQVTLLLFAPDVSSSTERHLTDNSSARGREMACVSPCSTIA